MKNGKKMIEMFPDATRGQRARKLWEKQKQQDSPVLTYILISGILLGVMIVIAALVFRGLTGALFDEIDTSQHTGPYTVLVILVICASYLLFDGSVKRWFQTVKRYFYGKESRK